MSDKLFREPLLEVIHFNEKIVASSNCGCHDEEWCPADYTNCTGDSAFCECRVNHIAGTANCTPCSQYS